MIGEADKRRVNVVCPVCGRAYPAWAADLERGRMKHCSRKCSGQSRRAKTHVEFNGESYYVNRDGYYVSSSTGRSLNRAVWEANFGPLPEGQKVYVKDGVRSNYDPDNLYLKEALTDPPRPAEGAG